MSGESADSTAIFAKNGPRHETFCMEAAPDLFGSDGRSQPNFRFFFVET